MKKEKKRHRTWINKHKIDNYIMRSAYYANLLQKHKHRHTLSLHKIKRKLLVKKTLSKAKQNKRQETSIERRSCHRTPLLPRKERRRDPFLVGSPILDSHALNHVFLGSIAAQMD